jgi:hypothetical protein
MAVGCLLFFPTIITRTLGNLNCLLSANWEQTRPPADYFWKVAKNHPTVQCTEYYASIEGELGIGGWNMNQNWAIFVTFPKYVLSYLNECLTRSCHICIFLCHILWHISSFCEYNWKEMPFFNIQYIGSDHVLTWYFSNNFPTSAGSNCQLFFGFVWKTVDNF